MKNSKIINNSAVNSGGGLFNLNGDLIGINTAIATDGFSRSNAGVGFAVPINQVMRVVNDLIKEGKVLRGFLGVTNGPIDEDMMKALDLNSKKGVLISFVSPDSPADIAGLKEKDIIISMNGGVIEDVNQLRNNVSNAKPGEVIVFGVIRDQTNQNIMVTLGLRPNQEEVRCLFLNLSKGPMKANDLLLAFKVSRRPVIFRSLVWLVKLNLIKLVG